MLTPEQQIFEQINKAKNILIVFGKNWDGDSVGSALALFLLCQKLEKTPEIVAEKPNILISTNSTNQNTGLFSFLPGYGNIKYHFEGLRRYLISLDKAKDKVKQVKYQMEGDKLNFVITAKNGDFTADNLTFSPAGFNYDLIVVLDSPDLDVLGNIYEENAELFYQTTIINIDHHPSNESYGQINYIEITATSTAEILFNLFTNYSRDLIDEDIATCLLAGIIAKTKSFKTSNVTPQALIATSQLISMGARREQIVNSLYRSRSLNILKLWGRVLARLSTSEDKNLVWSTLSQMDFAKTDSNELDLGDVIDELIISIPEAKVVALIFEVENIISKTKTTKLVLYSTRNIDALALIKELSPTGTKDLARATVNKSVDEAEKEIIALIEDQLNKLPL
jgi:phosphoesterase RecJ-like protein